MATGTHGHETSLRQAQPGLSSTGTDFNLLCIFSDQRKYTLGVGSIVCFY